jgi:hypothetical protein
MSPSVQGPCFGHMRLDTGARHLDVLLGNVSRTGPGLSLIDWQSAPLAEVFFSCGEGEDYELEVGERTVAGTLLEKNLLGFSRGELVRIDSPAGAVARRPDGTWEQLPSPSQPRLRPRPASARRPFRSPLEVKLDAAQQRVVELPANRSVLLLGEAGFGKTTVALHRLISLQKRAGASFRAAVMVPTDGLRRLTQLMLERQGVTGIEVWTYERWAATVARRAFQDLPPRESATTSAGIVRLKRHGALRVALAGFVRERPRPTVDEERPTRSLARARRADLEHLFGDREWMERVVDASRGALPRPVVQEVAEHTRVQFCDTTEKEFAHVRPEHLETVDGQRIDEGTPLEDAESVDVEDYAVLFELERLRALAHGARPVSPAAYDCILIDEAQEFAPLELSLIGRALSPRGTVIVAGDAAQQVDPTSDFGGWEGAMEDLGVREYERAVLEVNYRCPPEVTALARSVLDLAAPRAPQEAAISWARHESACHLTLWLTDELRELQGEDPSASIAVICRSSEMARWFARMLGHGLSVRLALEGDFDFQPGVTVTCVQEVKGLEFDHVLLPDAGAGTWPETAESRRALYVALTRATHQLVLTCAGPWSPLLGRGPR